eukprot:2423994-Rhodomonas_salina.2
MDVKKLTKKQVRELLARRDAGEPVVVPPEVEEMLMTKSEKRLKRITDMVDGQYSSKRLVSSPLYTAREKGKAGSRISALCAVSS